jgi:hypothetical protein
MKRQTTVKAVIIIFVLSLVSSLYATETRVQSMGGVGLYIRDNSNIFPFPGTIKMYGNQAIAELRTKGDDQQYTIGMHLFNASKNVYGVYLNRPLTIPQDILTDIAPSLTLDHCISLLYAGNTRGYKYGLILSVAMDKSTDESTGDEEKQSARYFGIDAGISNEKYDLGLNLELPAANWNLGDDEDKWSGTGIGLNGRYFSKRSKEMEFVGLATLYFGFSGREAGEQETNYNRMKLALGAAVNYQISDKNLAVLAVEAFGMNKDAIEVKDGPTTTNTTTTLPGIYLGVESQLKSWLIGRVGARQVYQTIKQSYKPDEGEESEESDSQSSFGVFFGLGIAVGNLEMDALFNESILFDGPNFISGMDNSLANRISITYYFDKPAKK